MFEIPPEDINTEKPYVYTIDQKTPTEKKMFKAKGIIKVPKKKAKPKTYNELTRSTKDKETITELISSIGNKTKGALLFNTRHMNELGDQVRHVHPYKFFGHVFSNPALKEAMNNILDDFWKRNTFISNMTPSLNNEHRTGSLTKYIKEFCKEVSVNGSQVHPYQIQPYVDARDWEGMLHFLGSQ
jgi:hypothetical protein